MSDMAGPAFRAAREGANVKSATGIVAVVVIIGCAAWLLYYQKSQPAPGEPVKNMTPLKCTSCGKAYAKMAGALPTKCHYCGETTAHRARQCAKCGAIVAYTKQISFSPEEEGEKITCECGSDKLREVDPKAIEIINP